MNKKILVALLLTAMFGNQYVSGASAPRTSIKPVSIQQGCSDCPPCKTICPVNPCRAKATSHSFFSVRPEYQAGMPERTTLWHDRMLAREGGRAGAIQLVPFGGRSTRSTDLAAFFTPNGKSMLNVCENLTDASLGECDIISDHFNIYTNGCGLTGDLQVAADANTKAHTRAIPTNPQCFKSTICFEPERSVAGLGFTYTQGFARKDNGQGFFFVLSFPLEKVKTSMNLGETIENNGDGALTCAAKVRGVRALPEDTLCPLESALAPNGQYTGPVGSMCEAFQQAAWAYGRIDESCHQNERVGVADIDILLGYDIVHTDHCYMRSYGGVLAPTGNTPNGVLLFEPIIGHNKHTILRYGGSFGLELWQHHSKDRNIWFDFQSEFFFFLNNKQVRSFDVKNKPWSRYMQVYNSFEQAAEAGILANPYLHTPGINVFTQEVKVNAGTARTYQSAFIFNNKSFQGEFGYTFFARPAECVELTCEFPQGIAFKSLEQAGYVNPIQMIGNNYGDINAVPSTAPNLYNLVTVKDSDLDLNSAAHPAMLTYIVYASMGNRWDDREYPFFLGGGGSYEFTKDNTGMTRWLLWAKLGFSF